MEVNEMLKLLNKLSQPELATIKAATEHLLTKQVDELDTTSVLYSTMATLLGVGLSYRDFHNVTAFSTWRKSAPSVVSFIEATFPGATKVAKCAMMTFLLEALIDDLRGRGVPISLGTVTVNIQRLPALFDECFPSYRETGLAHLVLSAMEKGE